MQDLTTRMETLRHKKAAPEPDRTRTQQTLEEIVAPLLKIVPLEASDALDKEMKALTDRIEASRASGIDPKLLAPIEHGLNEVRGIFDQLNSRESIATFRTALQDLTDCLSRPRGTHYVSPHAQIEAVIAAVRNVGGLAAAKDTLTALSDEVRGLSARLHRVLTQDRSAAASQIATDPAPETRPLSIEESLRDINRRLDALQKTGVDADTANRDKSAHDALEAVHATLSSLVAQLGSNLKGARGADAASLRHLSLSGGYSYTPRNLIDFADEHDADIEIERPRRSIAASFRPLIAGALIVVLAAVAARISMQLTELPLPAVTTADVAQPADKAERTARTGVSEPIVPDLVRSQAPDTIAVTPEAQPQQAGSAIGDVEHTGTIGRQVPVAVGSREAAREPSIPLPDSLPAALRAEAAKGRPAAEYEVGVRLVEGKSVPVNTEEGLRWLKRAAKSGIIPANLWIGSLYEKGLGVEKDLPLARTYYTVAAEKGNAKAMHNLAVLYAEGVDGRRDYKTAARWFQRAAERGIADSQYNFAILLMRGIGVDQNHQEAYKWFALAALQGDREAARQRDEIGTKLEAGVLAAAKAAVQKFTPQSQPNEAVIVATPPGGWDRAGSDSAGSSRRSQSGVFARGAS